MTGLRFNIGLDASATADGADAADDAAAIIRTVQKAIRHRFEAWALYGS